MSYSTNSWDTLSQDEQQSWLEKVALLVEKGYVETKDIETVAKLAYTGNTKKEVDK